MRDACLGIDIGTTSVKIVLLRKDGVVIKSWNKPHELLSPEPGFAEEDPASWEDGIFALLREAAAEYAGNIAAIGLTGMVPTLIPLDDQYRPLDNSIQQNDIRATREIAELQSRIDAEWFFKSTGNQVNQQHIFPKLVWLKRHKPAVFTSMKHILGSYDYAGYLLTGEALTEENWALESGMWDLMEKHWLGAILDAAEITENYLSPLVQPTALRGGLSSAAAERCGLPSGLPVFGGTADHIVSAFAVGAREPGDLVFKLGGAGDILLAMTDVVTDPRLFIDYACTTTAPYMINGCTASSGSLLKWAQKEFTMPEFTEMDCRASSIPPGSCGLVILPYFLGEKTPIFDTEARGVIFGLSLSHTVNHIYRSLLEAVAYSLQHHIGVFRELGLPVKRVFITNGGSKSKLWRSIIADVTGYELTYVANNQGSSAGAALLAGIGTGMMDERTALAQERLTISHNEAHFKIYEDGFNLYRALYENLKPLFKRIPERIS
jgi:xylulokinase